MAALGIPIKVVDGRNYFGKGAGHVFYFVGGIYTPGSGGAWLETSNLTDVNANLISKYAAGYEPVGSGPQVELAEVVNVSYAELLELATQFGAPPTKLAAYRDAAAKFAAGK